MRKLNIGCGPDKKDGYINIDYDSTFNPDIVRDIEKGLPFDDNSVDEIFCSHVLEHVKDLIFVMNEFWRVLKSGGKLFILVPPYDFEGAFSDPTHIRYFTPRTFEFFTEKRLKWIWGYPSKIKCLFRMLEFKRQSNKRDPTAKEYSVIFEAIK